MKTKLIACIAVFSMTLALSTEANAQAITRTVNGKKYTFLRGAFTQREAWREADLRRGYAVTFETMTEHTLVVNAFGLGRSEYDVCWTGHYQEPFGWEATGGWSTLSRYGSPPLHMLFNGKGPDDGITRNSPYGKNEDGGVIWKDNNGLLEDVSTNFRANVLIEHR